MDPNRSSRVEEKSSNPHIQTEQLVSQVAWPKHSGGGGVDRARQLERMRGNGPLTDYHVKLVVISMQSVRINSMLC